ncbi:MAG: phage integrase N-terminal SAM-like domain-containing protein, partial [Anaerolineae bacterium]|nr:phage integrase N-terminal SAM-like domain-containing protein [Anaerolineae bacterium]
MTTDFFDQFRAYLESADRSPRTVDVRLRDLEAFATWFEQTTGKPFEPVAVTPLDVRDYRAYLQTVKGLKPNTVNRALT